MAEFKLLDKFPSSYAELIEAGATKMAKVIGDRHGHAMESWLNDQRREEAKACFSVLLMEIEPLKVEDKLR
jgi:hypothetical protein